MGVCEAVKVAVVRCRGVGCGRVVALWFACAWVALVAACGVPPLEDPDAADAQEPEAAPDCVHDAEAQPDVPSEQDPLDEPDVGEDATGEPDEGVDAQQDASQDPTQDAPQDPTPTPIGQERCYPPACPLEERVEACHHGAGECAWDQGCQDERCGECETKADCAPTEVCLGDGSCGACTRDSECGLGFGCFEGVCLQRALQEWHLELAPEDWDYLHADPYDRTRVKPCRVTVHGTVYDQGCEIRIRGGASRDFPKKSFRIEFPEDAPHPGFTRKINLRAEYNDRTFLRNWLSYQMFARTTRLPTPDVRHVKLYLNGEFYGVFTEIERIASGFLDKRGKNKDSSMYEPDPPRELFVQGVTAFVPLPQEEMYPQVFQKAAGDEGEYGDLHELIEETVWGDVSDSLLSGQVRTARMRERIDIPMLVDYLAGMAVVQNQDHVKKNFYFSWQRGDDGRFRWEFYPWDLELSFGCLWSEEDQNTLCRELVFDGDPLRGKIPSGYPIEFPFEPFASVLIHMVLEDPELRAFFELRVCEMLNSDFWQARLPSYIDGQAARLREAVSQDVRDMNESEQEFDDAVEGLHTYMREREAFLRGRFGCPL